MADGREPVQRNSGLATQTTKDRGGGIGQASPEGNAVYYGFVNAADVQMCEWPTISRKWKTCTPSCAAQETTSNETHPSMPINQIIFR